MLSTNLCKLTRHVSVLNPVISIWASCSFEHDLLVRVHWLTISRPDLAGRSDVWGCVAAAACCRYRVYLDSVVEELAPYTTWLYSVPSPLV